MTHPAEAGNWYYPDGTPCYAIVGANGKERAPDVRDARKVRLLPGVTSVMRCAAKGFTLDAWIKKQVMLAALTLPRLPDEKDETFCERILADSEEQARKARERGTAIHAAIQDYYQSAKTIRDTEYWPYVVGAEKAIDDLCGTQEWIAECSFAHASGYAGKVDLHCDAWVLDIKGSEFDDPRKLRLYDEHAMQVGAYRVGLGLPKARGGIVFVSRNQPGLAYGIEIPQPDLERGEAMFAALLAFWKVKNRYDGGQQ